MLSGVAMSLTEEILDTGAEGAGSE